MRKNAIEIASTSNCENTNQKKREICFKVVEYAQLSTKHLLIRKSRSETFIQKCLGLYQIL